MRVLSLFAVFVLLLSVCFTPDVNAIEIYSESELQSIKDSIVLNVNVENDFLISKLLDYKKFQENLYIEKSISEVSNYSDCIIEKSKERINLISQYELSMQVNIVNANINYTIEKYSFEQDIHKLEVYEYVWFEYGYPDIEATDISGYGITHEFLLESIENNIHLISDNYVDDYMLEYSEAFQNNNSENCADNTISLAAVNYNYNYSPSAAITYADKWVPHSIDGGCNPNYYNPAYTYYQNNDCANYVSQCLYAGGMPQSSTWYPASSAWISVGNFRNYFNDYGVNVALTSSNIKSVVWKGCPLYIKDSSNSHVVICAGYSADGWPYLNGHTNDRYHQRVPTGYYTNTIQLIPYKDYEPNTQPPSKAIISIDKTDYAVDETVTFHFDTDGSIGSNVLWIYCPDGSSLYYTDLRDSYSLGFGMSGTFEALVQAWNGVGSKSSEKIKFHIGAPTGTWIKTDKTSYKVSETVNFSFGSSMPTDIRDLYIYLPDGTQEVYAGQGTSFSKSFSMPGKYEALAQSWNGVGSECSEKFTFHIGAPTGTWIKTDKISYKVNETVNFSFGSSMPTDIRDLYIYLPNGTQEVYAGQGTSFSKSFSTPGMYEALAQSWNDAGTELTAKITFYIKDEKPTLNTTVTKNKTSHLIKVTPENISQSCDIIAVGYNNGKLITAESKEYSGSTLEFTTSGTISEIKIMAWNSLSYPKPLCETEIVNSGEFISE